MDLGKVALNCLELRKKIISKLYQIQIKAVNYALQNLNLEQSAADGQPGKVIDFIKKWVAKEKMLIAHCVRTVFIPTEVDQAIDTVAFPTTEGTEDEEKVRQQ